MSQAGGYTMSLDDMDRGELLLDSRGRCRVRPQLDPAGDMERLHGRDGRHAVNRAPSQDRHHGTRIGPARVRAADGLGEQFEAPKDRPFAGSRHRGRGVHLTPVRWDHIALTGNLCNRTQRTDRS